MANKIKRLGTPPNGGDPLSVVFDPATHSATVEEVKAVVTVAEDHKATVKKVSIGITCDDDATNPTKLDAAEADVGADGTATSAEFTLPEQSDDKAITCTATASAEGVDEDATATFSIPKGGNGAGSTATHMLSFTNSASPTEGAEVTVTVVVKKIDDTEESGATFSELSAKWTCTKDSSDNFDYASAGDATADTTAGTLKFTQADATTANTDVSNCQLKVTAKVEVDGSEVVLKDSPNITHDIELADAA